MLSKPAFYGSGLNPKLVTLSNGQVKICPTYYSARAVLLILVQRKRLIFSKYIFRAWEAQNFKSHVITQAISK